MNSEELDKKTIPCFMCEMNTYSLEKRCNKNFVMERKEEFFPSDEFGNEVMVCESCKLEIEQFFIKKELERLFFNQ